jgi:DNA-binding CsgD family transcriptional regulator
VTGSERQLTNPDGALVERAGELALLREILTAADPQAAPPVLIEGEPGSGKSSLLQAALRLARGAGAFVCDAYGSDLERTFPFGVVRQLFEPPLITLGLGGTGPEALRDHGDGVLGALPRLPLGAGAGPEAGAAAGTVPVPAGVLEDMADLVRRLLLARPRRVPAVIAVDDLDYADRPSLCVLSHAIRRLHGLPVVFLATTTLGEELPDCALAAALSDFPAWQRISLGRLSLTGSSALLTARLGREVDPSLAAAAHTATGGNPFYLTELASDLAADETAPAAGRVPAIGPRRVARTVRARMTRQSPTAARVAETLAILEDSTDPSLVGDMCGLDERAVADALDVLDAVRLRRPVPPAGLTPPIVRMALYKSIPAAERSAAHRRAAELSARASLPPEVIARHLIATLPAADPWVAQELRAAARTAARRGERELAVRCLHRARREVPPAGLDVATLIELCDVELLIDPDQAIGDLRCGLAAAADPCRQARISLALAAALERVAASDQAHAVLEEARLALVQGSLAPGSPASAAVSLGRAAEQLLQEISDRLLLTAHAGRQGAARTRASHGGAGRQAAADTPSGSALAVRAHQAGMAGVDASSVVARARQALDKLGRCDVPWLALMFALQPLIWADELEAADGHCESILNQHQTGALSRMVALAVRADVAYRRGMVAQARCLAAAALRLVPPATKPDGAVGLPLGTLLEVLVEQGQIDEADQELRQMGFDSDIPQSWHGALIVGARARVRLARGDARGALRDLTSCGKLLESWESENPAVLPWRSRAAQAALVLGETERALRLAEEEVGLARRWEVPGALADALRVHGLAAGGETGLSSLQEAARLLEHSPRRLLLGHTLVDLGVAQRRASRRTASRDVLRQALHLAQELDLPTLAERARRELLAAGARPRRAWEFGPSALTPSEERVVSLAARGYSNREIAGTLFVTQRTVEVHLTHAFRKLGVTSRIELTTLG